MKNWRPETALAVAVFAAAVGTDAAAQGVYRWTDAAGKVHYGDVPSETAAELAQKNFGNDHVPEDAALPYEVRQARKNFPVTLYVSADCGDPCRNARELLNRRSVPFSERTLATPEEIDRFHQESGSDVAPTLQVGKTYLKGFEAGQWNGELNAAGYPARAAASAPHQP